MRFSETSFKLFQREVIIFGAQIVTGAIIARTLGPVAMGLWVILLMIPGYAEPIARLQVDTASVYVMGKRLYRTGEVAFALLTITLVTSSLFIAIFLWQQDRLYATFLAETVTIKHLVYIMLAYVPLNFLLLNYVYLVLGKEDIAGYNGIQYLHRLVPSVFGAILVLTTGWGVLALAIPMVTGTFAALIFGAYRIHRTDPIILNWNFGLMKALFSFGGKMYFTSVVAYMYAYGSGLIVVLYLTAPEIAFFRLAQERVLVLGRVSGAVSTLLYPRVVSLTNDPEQAKALTARSVRITGLLLFTLGGVGAALAKPGIFLLYGAEYNAMVLPMLILIPAIVIEVSSGLLNQHFLGRGRLVPIIGMTVVSLIIQLGLLWVAVPKWGIVGASVAILISFVIMAVIRIVVFSRLESVSVKDLVLIRRQDVAFLRDFARSRVNGITSGVSESLTRLYTGSRKP